MRLTNSVCLMALLATAQVQAKTDQILQAPPPKWVVQSEPLAVPADASGGSFIRRQDVEVHLDGKGQLIYTGYRIKILHPNALEAGNISLAWNPASGAPTVHSINVYRDGQIIDVLRKASFEVLRREDQLEASRIDGILTAVLRVPDLRVGDELEFAATMRTTDPTLGKDDAGLLFLGGQPGPGRYHLMLSWENEAKPNLKMTRDMAAVAEDGGNQLHFRFDSPSSIAPPKDAPPRFQWQRVVEYSSFPDWQALSRRFASIFATSTRLSANSPVKAEAARIAAAHADPFARAAAALKLVQHDVRYIYVGLNGGNLTPASAEATWQQRYGDCKAKTALLLAMLNELGIEAEAVLANNSGADDGLDARLPSARMFDHVLVRAVIGGKAYWLDGTLPPVVAPSAEPIMPYQWVLPLSATGKTLEQLPWKPQARPDEVTLFEIDARDGFDKPARITNTTIKRGIEGLKQQVQFSALTPAQLLTAFQQNAIGDTWQSIEKVDWRYDEKTQASVLSVAGSGTVDWSEDDDGMRSLALPGGGFNPPEKRVRPADQDQELPFYKKPEFDCRATSVRLPLNTRPEQWTHKDDIDTSIFGRTYYRAFDIRDGTLRMVRGARVEKPELPAADARRDNARIAKFDNSMAWITFDPAGKSIETKSARTVPATYEIDWTADGAPCLPAAMLTTK